MSIGDDGNNKAGVMRKKMQFIYLLFLLSTSCAFAQRVEKLFYYSEDSILARMPEYQVCLDSLKYHKKLLYGMVYAMDSAYVADSIRLQQDSVGLTAAVYVLRLRQLEDLANNKRIFYKEADRDYAIVSESLLGPLKRRIRDAAVKVGKGMFYKEVYERKIAEELAALPNANCSLVSITEMVIAQLKIR